MWWLRRLLAPRDAFPQVVDRETFERRESALQERLERLEREVEVMQRTTTIPEESPES